MLTKIKKHLKKVRSLVTLKRNIDMMKQMRSWKARGKPMPAPHKIKAGIIVGYGKAFGAETLVETGTFMGAMIDAAKSHFPKIISVELDPTLAREAQERFAPKKHVSILQGDSAELVPNILKTLSGKTVFWLDAHYSGGVTAKGADYTPILSETQTIASYPQKNTILLIDDARLFTGTDYPLLSDYKKFVTKLFPQHAFSVETDIIRVVPKNLTV